jgi:hypothetical protein
MNGIKNLLPKFIIAAGLAVIICLNRIEHAQSYVDNIPALLIVAFGGVLPFEGIAFYESVVAITPMIAHIVMFAEYISGDLPTVSIYVLPRIGKRDRWFFGEVIRLAAVSILYYALYIAIGIIMGICFGIDLGEPLALLTAIGMIDRKSVV